MSFVLATLVFINSEPLAVHVSFVALFDFLRRGGDRALKLLQSFERDESLLYGPRYCAIDLPLRPTDGPRRLLSQNCDNAH